MLPTILTVLPLLAPAPESTSSATLTRLSAFASPESGNAGAAVAVTTNLAVVGEPGAGSGRVTVYERAGTSFAPVATLVPSDGDLGDAFGATVAASQTGDTLLVGAPGEDGVAPNSGAAYVFSRIGSAWVQVAKIKAFDPALGDAFGSAVDVRHAGGTTHRILVGAPNDGHTGASLAGSAYAYRFDASSFQVVFETKLTAPVPEAGAHFGAAVAQAGNAGGTWGFVGAPGDSMVALRCGVVYGFLRSSSTNTWSYSTADFPGDPDPFMGFGSALSAAGDHMLIGAPGHDGAGGNAGGAYVFTFIANLYTQNGFFSAPTSFGAAFGNSVSMSQSGAEYRMAVGAAAVGTAYTFEGTAHPWGTLTAHVPADGAAGTRFGTAVARRGADLWIGAPLDGDAAVQGGATYALDEAGGSWVTTKHLPPAGPRPAHLGDSIDSDGQLLVAGAPLEGGTGPASGAAYVWERNGSSWSPRARLTAENDSDSGLNFGEAVAVDGDTVAVGAPGSAAGTDSHVYVFRDVAGVWAREADLAIFGDAELGAALTLEGDRLVAGAPSLFGHGAVVVYDRVGTHWNAGTVVHHPEMLSGSDFGRAFALDGPTMAVGAPRLALPQQVGDPGAVYVMQLSGGAWVGGPKLISPAPNANGNFGLSVALDGEWLAVGERGALVGAANTGAVHLFRKTGSAFTFHSTVDSPSPTSIYFGYSVALDGSSLLVGHPFDDSGGANGSGSAWLFRWSGVAWELAGELPAALHEDGGLRGSRLALVGNDAFVGVRGASSTVGAIEVYELPQGPSSYCTGKTSSLGCVPFLSASGTPSVTSSQPFLLGAHDVLPNEPGFLLYGFAKSNLAFHGGKLCVKIPFRRLLPPKAASSTGQPPCSGYLQRNFQNRIQNGVDPLLTAGQRVFAQWRLRDPADAAGFGDGFTDAVRFTVCP